MITRESDEIFIAMMAMYFYRKQQELVSIDVQLTIRNQLCTTMTIGVYKMNHQIDTSEPLRAEEYKGIVYAWKVDSGKLTKGDQDSQHRYTDREFQDGDIIEMILDLNAKQLRFICNSEDFGVAYEQIEDTSYRAAVSFYDEDYSIQFLEYTASRW